MKRLWMLCLCAVILLFSAGCVYDQTTHFHEKENIGTRWVCREVNLYFDSVEVEETLPPEPDVAEPKETTVQYVWHPGQLTVNDSVHHTEVQFGYPASFSLYFAEDSTRPNDAYHEDGEGILHGNYELEDDVLTVYLATADTFTSLTGYTGDRLTFVRE